MSSGQLSLQELVPGRAPKATEKPCLEKPKKEKRKKEKKNKKRKRNDRIKG